MKLLEEILRTVKVTFTKLNLRACQLEAVVYKPGQGRIATCTSEI